MIYEDRFGNFLGENEVNNLEASRIQELGIHVFDMEEALRG